MSRPNIILDLDQTLISTEASEEFNFEKYKEKSKLFTVNDMDGYYLVYSRPHLQSFLDYVFKNFNVTVWTAASKDYALFIVDNILLGSKKDRKLDFIMFSYHCEWSKRCKKYTKSLEMLWDVYGLDNYNSTNTVIIDDYKKDVHKCQPENCIIAKPFEFREKNSEHDDFLKKLIPHLKTLKKNISKGKSNLTGRINKEFGTIA